MPQKPAALVPSCQIFTSQEASVSTGSYRFERACEAVKHWQEFTTAGQSALEMIRWQYRIYSSLVRVCKVKHAYVRCLVVNDTWLTLLGAHTLLRENAYRLILATWSCTLCTSRWRCRLFPGWCVPLYDQYAKFRVWGYPDYRVSILL